MKRLFQRGQEGHLRVTALFPPGGQRRSRSPFIFSIFLMILLIGSCAACAPLPQLTPQTARPALLPTQIVHTPTLRRPQPGAGGVTGQAPEAPVIWPEEYLTVYAAPFQGDEQGQGFYVLEPFRHPSADVDASGFFQLSDVPPGRYFLVLGPSPEGALLIVDESYQARLIEIKANEVLQLGEVVLAP